MRIELLRVLTLSLAGLAAGTLPAQNAAPDFSNVQVRATNVAGNLYALEGQGGTVSVLTGPDGAVLIDSQFAPLTDKLVAAIRGFSQAPLRFLVNTHVHGDHTGGNANFAKLGATIIAHDNVRQRLRFRRHGRQRRPGHAGPGRGAAAGHLRRADDAAPEWPGDPAGAAAGRAYRWRHPDRVPGSRRARRRRFLPHRRLSGRRPQQRRQPARHRRFTGYRDQPRRPEDPGHSRPRTDCRSRRNDRDARHAGRDLRAGASSW